MTNPVLVEVFRNNVVESCHRGSVVVVDDNGEMILALGDVSRDIYPRSSLKLFQAIPLVESGAAGKFELSDREIAVACASHSAEAIHLETVTGWLARIGLGTEDLENGPDMPLSDAVKKRMIEDRIQSSSLHQTCSGKHTGMLTLARYLGEETSGYSEYSHPVQQRWMQTLSELVNIDVGSLVWERDGCGMPAICMPMVPLALGCALFANPDRVGGARGTAMKKILAAVQSEPDYIAGSERCCSHVIGKTQGSVVVKTGAEGVYTGVLPDMKIGFVIKIDDGNTRGSEVALGGLLNALGAIGPDENVLLDTFFRPAVINSQGRQTGRILPATIWNEVSPAIAG